MKIWTCNTFAGFWPVGSAAVVQAKTRSRATSLLNKALKAHGLKGDAEPKDALEFPAEPDETVRILVDGEY